jgi:hypothetical protein
MTTPLSVAAQGCANLFQAYADQGYRRKQSGRRAGARFASRMQAARQLLEA